MFNDITNDDNEVVFSLGVQIDTLIEYVSSLPCDENEDLIIPSIGETEMKILTFVNPELPRDIIIRLTSFPGGNEELGLFYGLLANRQFNAPEVQGLLVHIPVSDEPQNFSVLIDSLNLGDKVFNDVIEPNLNNPGFFEFDPPLEVKYTKEDGIIYINDLINSRELVFNRIE